MRLRAYGFNAAMRTCVGGPSGDLCELTSIRDFSALNVPKESLTFEELLPTFFFHFVACIINLDYLHN